MCGSRVAQNGSDWLIGKLNTRCYADSESQRRFLVGQGVIAAKQLFVIGAGSLAGVDLERFNSGRFSSQDREATRHALEIPDGVPVLLFVGRITADKGIRELLEAFRELKAAGSGAHLVIVGNFDSGSGAGEAFHDAILKASGIRISSGTRSVPKHIWL